METIAVIPSLNPCEKILKVVTRLIDVGFIDIVIVDDGSEPTHQVFFHQLEQDYGCVVLHHQENLGKGAALKTALRYCLQTYPNNIGIVTLDDDGQHLSKDVLKVARVLEKTKDKLVLGVRDFHQRDIPFKSKWGNKLTAGVFRFCCGLHISDTQTGLRGIPRKYYEVFLETKGERFEYETSMLLDTKEYGIDIEEVVIETVYINNNETTHFHPVLDSLKIGKILIKYFGVSICSFLLDFSLFVCLCWILPVDNSITRIFLATYISRFVSSIFNFSLNRKIVFHSKENMIRTLLKYYALCIIQGSLSAFLISIVTTIYPSFLYLIKIGIDIGLSLCSFQIQRIFVFASKK